MKKRVLLCVLAGAVILSCGTASVYAASSWRGNGNRAQSANFIDTDNDGVCDNRTDGGACPQDGTGMRRGNKGNR